MSTISPFIKMTLQALDENEDTWGTVLNASALELLEDALCGTATASVTVGHLALNENAGSDNAPHYRMMIINVTGTPGAARNVTVPPTSKVYLVANNVSDSSVVTFKTTAGTGIAIPAGDVYWLYCNGTNILAAGVSTAATADSATSADDADSLGGAAAALYAKLATQQTFTKGQTIQRVALTAAGGIITPNITNSNAFYYLADENFQVAAPTNGVNGSMFSLIIEQDAGAPYTISYQASTFIFADGIAPVLSTGVGDIDYLAFEYVTNLSGGARWIGSIIKGIA